MFPCCRYRWIKPEEYRQNHTKTQPSEKCTLIIGMYCVQRYHDCHDDVIKWKHFPRHWPFMREIHRSPVNSPHKGQWRRALKFSLICVWINSWVNNREAGDLRRYRNHYDVTVMCDMRVPIPVRSQCMGLTNINRCLAKVPKSKMTGNFDQKLFMIQNPLMAHS